MCIYEKNLYNVSVVFWHAFGYSYWLQIWLWRSSLCAYRDTQLDSVSQHCPAGAKPRRVCKGSLVEVPLCLINFNLIPVLLKLILGMCFLLRWLTWGCYSTLAPISATCGTSWTSLWSVGPWWHLPSRKYIFLITQVSKGINCRRGRSMVHGQLRCSVCESVPQKNVRFLLFIILQLGGKRSTFDLLKMLPALEWVYLLFLQRLSQDVGDLLATFFSSKRHNALWQSSLFRQSF